MKIEEKKDIEQLIAESGRILITTRGNPGFDDVGSALAWYHWLSEKGKEQVDIAIDLDERTKYRFNFMPGFDQVQSKILSGDHFVISLDTTKAQVKELSYDMKDSHLEIVVKPQSGNFSEKDVSFADGNPVYDLIIVLGASELASIGSIFSKNRQLFFDTPIVNIGRTSSNVRFGQVNAVYLTATSLSEIAYEFMKKQLNKNVATSLLAGLIASTNSFQTPQVTPDTLSIASELIVAGAEREQIIDRIFRNKDMAKLKLWGRVLSNLQQASNNVVYSHLRREEVGNAEIDLHGLVDELVMASPEAHIVLFFFQESDSETRVHAYSRENYDLPLIFKKYRPEGRRRQVTFALSSDTVQTEIEILQHVMDQIRMISQ